MKVDTALEANAIVYELEYPDSLADKLSGNRMNMAFGPYRVTDADASWARTGSQAEDPDPIFHFKKVRESGKTTTTTEVGAGPTSLYGYTRPAAEGEPSLKKISQSIKYKFKVGQDNTWNALCSYRAKERVTEYKNRTDVEMLSSNFTCQYTVENRPDSEIWMLSIEYDGTITMTQKGKPNMLTAHSTGGNYFKPNGQATKISTRSAGYTWQQSEGGNDKNVAAISVREETPRVWLDKGNSDDINHVLSMANTGLLIYIWGIQH